ncbi:MAG TPA: DUF4160 domain-containing protein [Actinomycetota bacterium]
MPVISTFFGIVIRMYYREHGVPHFHAEYQGRQATFTFDGKPLAGSLGSTTASRLIREWAFARRDELELDWERARASEPLERIPPLE